MKNKKRKVYAVLLCCVLLNLLSVGAVHAVTIATFADPTADGSTPLLEIDLNNDKITSRWDDDLYTGLTLDVMGTVYNDAFFIITDSSDNVGVGYTGPAEGGLTSAGKIKFFHDGQDVSSEPLVLIEFDSAQLSFAGLAGSDFMMASNVTITGSAISNILTDETFSFALGNHIPINGEWANGYTTTSAFSCSANVVPEPATIGMIGIGWLIIVLGHKRNGRKNVSIS